MTVEKLNCQNYRGTSLLCTAYKTFTTILKNKLEPYAEKVLRDYQAGFRQGRSTIDQIFTVKQMLEKCWEYNTSVYLVFIDQISL
jgi:sorting nexin-29